jgi:hypothetical protein
MSSLHGTKREREREREQNERNNMIGEIDAQE